MRLPSRGKFVSVAKVPIAFAAITARGTFSTDCLEDRGETCHDVGPLVRDAYDAGSASLLQHRHQRSHASSPALTESDSGGCCFSFGYAAMMEPCCLTTEEVADRELCGNQQNLVGGKIGFTAGACPASPLEAEALTNREEDDPEPPLLGEDREELQKNLEASLTKAQEDANQKDAVAQDKLAVEKEKEAAAAKVGDDARRVEGILHPEAADDSEMNQTFSEKAMLEAKTAAREAMEAVLNASEAALVVTKGLQLKRLVESKVAVEETHRLKKEVAEFGAAIKQAEGLDNLTQHDSHKITENLAAASFVKKTEVAKSWDNEVTRMKALEDAKVQTMAAEENTRNATTAAEEAKRAEEEARQASVEGSEGSASSDDKAPDSTAGCRWTPAPRCVEEFAYESHKYYGCNVDVARYLAWCSHDAVYNGTWSSCTYSCDAPPSNGQSTQTDKGASSVADSSESSYSSTPDPIVKAGSHRELDRWGHGESNDVLTAEGAVDLRSCQWRADSDCVPGFRYQGKVYTGCAGATAEQKAWCSMDLVYVGRWKMCSNECGNSAAATNGVALAAP